MNLASVDLNLLVHFDVLMREKNVTRAAESLNITQPAMSNILRRLRKTFNDPLLIRSSEGMTPTERQISAKARFDGAMAEAGSGLSDVLWRVVCAGEAMGAAEGALGWPSRSGRVVLTIALDRVADWYRLG